MPSNNRDDFFAQRLLSDLSHQPALSSAFLVQDLSAKVGFDFRNIDLVVKKVREEHEELLEAYRGRHHNPEHYREELGDVFFALVNLCRHSGVDPEALVKENVRKYLLRCDFIEEKLRSEGKRWRDLTLDEIYQAWREAKASGL